MSNHAPTTVLSAETLRAVAERHGLPIPAKAPTPLVGATSHVYPLGPLVLKVPYDTTEAIAAFRRDLAVSPIARAAGVSTPEVIAVVDVGDLLPVPYALIERIEGEHLVRPDAIDDVGKHWRLLGQQLGLVHQIEAESVRPLLRTFLQSPEVDPRPWVEDVIQTGRLTTETGRWLGSLLEQLAPAALAPVPVVFCHGDINVTNVLVQRSLDRVTLIDWAGAGWLDPVWDFAGVPLVAVPAMLAGHREISPLVEDATAEARVVWCHVQLVLDRLRQSTTPDPASDTRRWVDAIQTYLKTLRAGRSI